MYVCVCIHIHTYDQLSPILFGSSIPCDTDSVQWGPFVVDVINKFTQTAEVLWRKKDGMATL